MDRVYHQSSAAWLLLVLLAMSSLGVRTVQADLVATLVVQDLHDPTGVQNEGICSWGNTYTQLWKQGHYSIPAY